MLELISEQTLCRLFSINWWLSSTNCWCFWSVISGRVTLTISKNDNLWYLGHGLAGPVQALMSWRVAIGSIGRPPRTAKIWRMEREGSNCKSTLKLLNFSSIGPQWVVSHPKWDLLREVESRVLANLDHIRWKGWIYIARGAHSWYSSKYSNVFIHWFHTHPYCIPQKDTDRRDSLKSLQGLRALVLERITSINHKSNVQMIWAQVETYSSFPSLDPIFHYVPMTQLSLTFDKTSIENSPTTPFHFKNEPIDEQIQKCMPVTLWSSTSSNSI